MTPKKITIIDCAKIIRVSYRQSKTPSIPYDRAYVITGGRWDRLTFSTRGTNNRLLYINIYDNILNKNRRINDT